MENATTFKPIYITNLYVEGNSFIQNWFNNYIWDQYCFLKESIINTLSTNNE